MPLFMDTPFGRLSYEHRQNLIKMVPQLSSQWVLLATDTEFRKQEARLLTLGGCLGKFYMLRPTDDGSTTIEERDIHTVQAILKSEEDLQ
jgi:DNA sulfur modification protein DndD